VKQFHGRQEVPMEQQEGFGPRQTVHGRFARWAADDTFDRILSFAQSRPVVDWLVAIDSTIVRAHQHTAAKGGSKKHGLGRPRGGLTGEQQWGRRHTVAIRCYAAPS
jgi:hypothetical protein